MNIIINWTEEQQKEVYNTVLEMHKKAYEEVTNQNMPYLKKFLNKQELLNFLKIGHNTLAEMKLHGLKPHKVGRQELYNLDEVYKSLEKM